MEWPTNLPVKAEPDGTLSTQRHRMTLPAHSCPPQACGTHQPSSMCFTPIWIPRVPGSTYHDAARFDPWPPNKSLKYEMNEQIKLYDQKCQVWLTLPSAFTVIEVKGHLLASSDPTPAITQH
ncbi:hypothetical protein E2C01_025724 [Portunus trituberculatus]|uniref:Uncharacterized protein n=1 Tax=Portunus trituberculatus TaxID=210409 RepID=A0A5B7EH87_PORTR|nr:hypothetical protein [Portunus trituberculatus]